MEQSVTDPEREKEIGERLQAMCKAHGPSKDILRLHAYENERTAFVVEQYGGFVSQFELFFDVINNLVVGANYLPKVNWPPHRSIQFLLVANNIRFLYNSFESLVKTYW